MIKIKYDKIKVFSTELGYIQNLEIRSLAEKIISNIPDYFFEVAASSTGKYHPTYALGGGGLVRHTKAAVGIAADLLKLEHNSQMFNPDERDCIIAALICHDGWKHGDEKSQYVISAHPVVAADHVLELADDSEKSFAKVIADNIRSHMGEWNTDYRSKAEIMPKPSTPMEMFVHECDYLASRKYLVYEFDNSYNPNDYIAKEEASNLKSRIAELIKLCTSKIANGADRDELYKIISEKNNGNKNPNSITDIKVAEDLIKTIGGTE
jgi:hypothetical protein